MTDRADAALVRMVATHLEDQGESGAFVLMTLDAPDARIISNIANPAFLAAALAAAHIDLVAAAPKETLQ